MLGEHRIKNMRTLSMFAAMVIVFMFVLIAPMLRGGNRSEPVPVIRRGSPVPH